MIKTSVSASLALSGGRLDARFHCSPGVMASEQVETLKSRGFVTRPISGINGLGQIEPTTRTKRVYAAPGEESVPYLRPYDVFDYLPQPADFLSMSEGTGVDRLSPARGTILQTCSGRNLGPLAYADAYLSRFAISDDMLRLHIDDETERLYALAFLSTPTGQSLLTRSKTGNVIDHLSAGDLGRVEVPFLGDELLASIVSKMRETVEKRETARLRLDSLIRDYENSIPRPSSTEPLAQGWTQNARDLTGRIDSAYYDPVVEATRQELLKAGGVRVGDVAETFIPGRYKRYYVEADRGRPIVSGRQLLQTKPVNLRYIAARSFDFATYALEQGMVAFGAEGRAEDRISLPVLVTSDRSGWLANNHVMRVRPKPGINPGWLYLSFAAAQVQAQVRASSCGSVVDSVSPSDLNQVVLPPPDAATGNEAVACWDEFAHANELERTAIEELEASILSTAGAPL